MIQSRRQFAQGLVSVIATHGSGEPAAHAQYGSVEPNWDAQLPDGVTPSPIAGRLVGISYSIWFRDRDADWKNEWGVPKLGYYKSDDPAILRQHAAWLYDAGVDFILLDLSNDLDSDWLKETGNPVSLARLKATRAMFDVWSSLARSPKVVFLLGASSVDVFSNGRLTRKADEITTLFLTDQRYQRLKQTYLGKPLLVVFIGPTITGRYVGSNYALSWRGGVPPWNDARFTTRFMGGFLTDQPAMMSAGRISKFGYWSWEDRGPPSYPVYGGHPEVTTLVAAWHGPSPRYAPVGRRNGETFKREWEYARRIGPHFALTTTFNEWWRGEQQDSEFSRDIEPSQQFGFTYLNILKRQANLFKQGV